MKITLAPRLPTILVLLAVGFYFYSVIGLSVGFPFQDDYDAILGFMLNFVAAETIQDKARMSLAQHNEHRIAFLRLVAASMYSIRGVVDFRELIFIGSIGLLTLSAAIIIGAKRTIQHPWVLAAVPILILSPLQGYQVIWAMASVSNFWALAFAVLALLFLTRPGRANFVLAIVFAIAATFTSGQGIVCLVAGLMALVLQRRWSALATWLAVASVISVVYFHGYERPSHHPSLELSFRAVIFFPMIAGGVVSSLLLEIFRSVASVLGIGVHWRFPYFLHILVGCIILVLAAYVLLKDCYRRNIFLSAVIIFGLGLCLAASLSRSGFGLDQAMKRHYHAVSLLVFIGIVLALVEMRWRPQQASAKVEKPLLALILMFLIPWIAYLSDIRSFSNAIDTSRKAFLLTQDSKAVLFGYSPEGGSDILLGSYLIGIMSLHDFDESHGINLSPSQLQRIGIAVHSKSDPRLSAVDGSGVRMVAGLDWHGNDFVISLLPSSGYSEDHSGWIGVHKGRVVYSSPTR